MAPKVAEEEARFWDILIKIGGGTIALVTLLIGFQTLGRRGDQLQLLRDRSPPSTLIRYLSWWISMSI